ncbi:hypothetical protein E4P40_26475 [Blastococcus sp. CT_GayMR20]|uniref:hypothetical protein n=1 Tax=Blastococcus sp. CT_GayMR20 TaxID=2559609 RepID=UPI0010738141|nr:hypothetical protein [Blastococcus sp. CT_GayMR20]TFV65386.1 hypothetical protein E4P40_26475 [Blastococcus sp. CT_GayMR20]
MHLHLPHLPLPLAVLSALYALAITVAVANPGRPTLAGLVVLAGLTARWVAHHRRSVASRTVVLTTDVAPAPAAPA